MEKKKYIIPECEVVEMETVTVIAGSTPEVGEDKETGVVMTLQLTVTAVSGVTCGLILGNK